MSSDKDEQVAGGEASADYIISESGKQQEDAVEMTEEKRVVAYRLLPIQSKIK
jgi:hypothetical protein